MRRCEITFDACSLFCSLLSICRRALLTGLSVKLTQHLRLAEHESHLCSREEDEGQDEALNHDTAQDCEDAKSKLFIEA